MARYIGPYSHRHMAVIVASLRFFQSLANTLLGRMAIEDRAIVEVCYQTTAADDFREGIGRKTEGSVWDSAFFSLRGGWDISEGGSVTFD